MYEFVFDHYLEFLFDIYNYLYSNMYDQELMYHYYHLEI